MTLVFVAKNMQVSNPVGAVNLHPLPEGLPSGLVRAHMMRHSLANMRLNLVNGQDTGIEEYVTTVDGTISYANTHVASTHRRAGWRDSGYAVDYDVGYTWLFVAAAPPIDLAVYAATESHAGGSGNPPDSGEEFSWRDGDRVRMSARRVDGVTNAATANVAADTGQYFMSYGVLDRPADEIMAYVPHTDTLSTKEESEDTAPPPAVPGLVLCRASQAFTSNDAPTDLKMALFAAWNRPLSQQEMQSAYNLLKPWLASRGVEIA